LVHIPTKIDTRCGLQDLHEISLGSYHPMLWKMCPLQLASNRLVMFICQVLLSLWTYMIHRMN